LKIAAVLSFCDILQCLSLNQRTALAEITDVLRAVCHAHRLPLALTWIPCTLEEDGEKIMRIQARESNSNSNKKPVLCIEETACYVNDKEMQGFVHACAEHPLEEGQGVAGKAVQSNIPFFSSDVKNYHINEYPLVQHARKFQLNAAVAIRLRTTNTGSDDYILEFFLPINMKGTKEQQLLLDSLSGTMQRICRSLRTVADAELDGSMNSEVELCRSSQSCFPRDVPMMNSQPLVSGREFSRIGQMSFDVSVAKTGSLETDGPCEKVLSKFLCYKLEINLCLFNRISPSSKNPVSSNAGISNYHSSDIRKWLCACFEESSAFWEMLALKKSAFMC